MNDQDIQDRIESLRRAKVALARDDINVFAQYVLRDERTGATIKLAPIHREMNAVVDASDRVVVWGFVESGKSELLVIARILHALGRDPSLRIAIVSNTVSQATKLLKKIATLIARSPEVREVFPHLVPATPWRENAIGVKRKTNARDPSIQAVGVNGNVLGSRLDMVFCDDAVDLQNSRSEHGRAMLKDWVMGTLFGRLTAGARVLVIGNAFHPFDLMHDLEKLPGWTGKRFPVLDARGDSTWPERWPLLRIDAKRSEVGPLEFARTMMCLPRSDDDSRFKRADIEACIARGRGIGSTFAASIDEWRPTLSTSDKRSCRFYIGVDLAVQVHAAADQSCVFCIAVHPDGLREIVGIELGRWTAEEILQRIGDAYRRWGGIVTIENVAAQDWMRQFALKDQHVPSVPYTTGRGKASLEFQAEGLSAEIANHRWIIPADLDGTMHPRVVEWVTSLLFYVPSAHCPDILAACLFARFTAQQADGALKSSAAQLLGGGAQRGCWG